jgi:cell division septation protein DedD
MTDDTNKANTEGEGKSAFESDDFTDKEATSRRREPVFSGFDEEEDYEEPERDTDYASRYVDDELDDGIDIADETGELDLDWSDDEDRHGAAEFEETPDQDWRHENEDEREYLQEDVPENTSRDRPPWEEEEGEEEYESEYAEEAPKWPLGLVAAALFAVILLAAGGYGVLQQRAATEEEIRDLRAQLATATKPVEQPLDTTALADARRRNIELSVAMESLKLENQRLNDTVAGLEAQLEAQQKALAGRPEPTPNPKPVAAKPAPAPKAASSDRGATGIWFVNFGSYSQRPTADSWAARLKPASGRAVVTTGTRDGKTFYRVRVIDLADKAIADKVARQLESEYGLDKLWVGR